MKYEILSLSQKHLDRIFVVIGEKVNLDILSSESMIQWFDMSDLWKLKHPMVFKAYMFAQCTKGVTSVYQQWIYRQTSNISTKSQKLNVSCLVLQLVVFEQSIAGRC